MTINAPTMQKDVYKEFHVRAIHPEVTESYANYTSRSDKHSNIKDGDGVVFVGLQYFILDYLIDEWYYFFSSTKAIAVANHKRILSAMVGYQVDTQYLEDLWELGYLPLEIKALEEGTIVPYQVAPMTIRNTVEGYQWLPLMIETVLSTENWPIQTSATTSVAYFRNIKKAFEDTGGPMELLPFMGHDFSFRGMFGRQAAAMSGFGHLASGFAGTDTIPAVLFAEKYYGADVEKELVGASVDATEHSVTCSWLDEGELAFIRYLMKEASPKGILSIVSDTWDFWRLVTEYLPILKDEIMARDGTVVIRPDSGDPVDIICGTDAAIDKIEDEDEYWDFMLGAPSNEGYIFEFKGVVYEILDVQDFVNSYGFDTFSENRDIEDMLANTLLREVTDTHTLAERKGLVECLWDTFGGTTTEQGFKLLDSHIGAIYGDAITLDRQAEIIRRLMSKGFVPSVVLGIGSYSFQYVTRDTHGSAVKSTHVVKAGKDVAIFKDPKTDPGKKSAKGLLRVEKIRIRDEVSLLEKETLVMYDNQTREQEQQGLLKTVFLNGELVRTTTLAKIRTKIAEQL